MKHVPVTLILVAFMWALFPWRAHLGYDLPADVHLWHLITAGLSTTNVAQAIYATLAAVCFAVPAERVLGSRRFVVAAAASHALVFPLACVLGAMVEQAGFNRWGADLVNETYLTPLPWMIGPLAFASASMGVLWRRRVRLVLVALTGTLVLYSGTLTSVAAFIAVVVGLVCGVLAGARQFTAARPTLREARVLVAVLLLAVSVGPVLTALNPAAQGPFAAESLLMWEPAVAAREVQERCVDPSSLACREAMAINQQSGLGPLLLNLVPVVLAVVLALGLRRGRRLAWWGATVLCAASLVVVVAQVLDVRSDALTTVNAGLVVLPWALMLAVLIAQRAKFRVGSNLRPMLVPGIAVLLSTTTAWVTGALILRDGFIGDVTLSSVVAELPARFMPPAVAVQLGHQIVPNAPAAWVLHEWVGVVFWGALLWMLFRVLSSAPSAPMQEERERARRMLESGTGDHLAWMGLWDGNRYFFAGDSGYVAYRVSHNVAVTVGSPVVAEGADETTVADAFEHFAADQGWRVAWYSVPETFHRPGFRTVHVAEESLLHTDNLEFKGKKFQNIRTARNRAAKEGVRPVWTTWRECTLEMRERIVALSEQWVADKALPEMGFTLGGLDELDDDATKLLLAVDEEGRLHGVTSWLPVYEHGKLAGYTLDFMRRDAEGFRPVIEFLLAEAAVIAGSEGLEWVSLSGAPLARTDAPTSFLEIVLDKTGAQIEPLYGFRSLAASKHKFHPTHTSWNLAYDDEMALASIGLAVVDCYLPDMKATDMVAVVKEFMARRGVGSSQSGAPTQAP